MMTLHEKIFYYRKAAKLSQEELAAQLGVSRQAVSKWELGEAVPDTGKLLALARTLHVTADHLLDEETDLESGTPVDLAPPEPHKPPANFFARFVRRFGWLAGLYIAFGGAAFAAVGGIARYICIQLFSVTLSVGEIVGNTFGWADSALGGGMPELSESFTSPRITVLSETGKIFVYIATAILIAGVVIAIAGLVMALLLYIQKRLEPNGPEDFS